MPNTKSAERRMRSSLVKEARNRAVKSRLKTLEKKYLTLVQQGNKDEATVLMKKVASAFDKAAKSKTIHWAKANRKKSRLSIKLGAA